MLGSITAIYLCTAEDEVMTKNKRYFIAHYFTQSRYLATSYR